MKKRRLNEPEPRIRPEHFEELRAKLLDNCVEEPVSLPDPCWIWQGSTRSTGYAQIWWQRENHSAHRVAYRVFVGDFPEDRLICHHCDTPLCCNPEHLYVGTQQTNADDRVARGRGAPPRGEQHHNVVLTDKEVAEVLQLVSEGNAQAAMLPIGWASLGFTYTP